MTERAWFRAEDGTMLSALVDSPGGSEPAARGFSPPHVSPAAVLLLPGFWRRAESRRIRWLAEQLARRFRVYTLDFRGHGRSSGAFTFGRLEHLDVEALMKLARSQGVERVALVGMSMGAASIASTLGGEDEPPVSVAGAVMIAGPADMAAIRPRPWRGRRDVAWADMLHVPRVEWRVPFTDKRVPRQRFARFPDVPVRFLHARGDWLVDPGAAERMHESNPQRGDFYLIEAPGLHADELLGRWRELVLRLVRPFVDGALAPQADPAPGGGAVETVDAGPWLDALRATIADPAAHSRDLGGLAPTGELGDAIAVAAGRDGVNLVVRAGGDVLWARGLRDGSVHGVNLLANALAADAPGWSPSLRRSLADVFTRLSGTAAPGPGSRHVVTPRGEGGFEVGLRGS